MRRLLTLLTLALLALPARAGQNYTDWWADTNIAGSSINIAQQGDIIFMAWYLYDAGNKAKWLYGAVQITGDNATIDLYEATGPFLGAASSVVSTKVGTATFSFLNTGSLLFQFNTTATGSGTLNLTRFKIQGLPLAGTYYGGYVTRQHDCASSSNNGVFPGTASYDVTVSGSNLSITENAQSGACTYSGPLTQNGSRFGGAGTFTCNGGMSGTWTAKDGLLDNGRLFVDIEASIPGVCEYTSHISGTLTSKL
jgi:hypothetical protein